MVQILQKQYGLVQGSRGELLKFVENQVGPGLNTPVAAFEARTIRYMLVHIAGCYFHWLEKFAVKRDIEKLDNEDFGTASQIRALFGKVDETMMTFLKNFDGKMEQPINRTLSQDNRQVSATPLEIFTHVTTHEFHHKGQIVTMCRLLGYPPPDTDIIRF